MAKLWVTLVVLVSILLVACAGEENGVAALQDRDLSERAPSGGARARAAVPALPAGALPPRAPAPTPTLQLAAGEQTSPRLKTAEAASGSRLEVAQRQVISTASVALEVEDVQGSVDQARSIVESLGGFVETLSSSGRPERQRATVTLRVPQPDFFTALERIIAVGEVLSQSVGSEDVTEQFIDLRARLQSAQREEQSLLSLLQKATSVSDVLIIERELSRVRSEIERSQGQLNFLERRVDLATITVSLSQPPEEAGEPPFGSLELEVADVAKSVDQVKAAVASLKGVVDEVSLSDRFGDQWAEVTFRVFTADFGQAMATMERQGKVVAKDVNEGKAPPPGAKAPTRPNARITISLTSEPDSEAGLIAAIAAPIGILVLLALVLTAYWWGRRRRGTRGV